MAFEIEKERKDVRMDFEELENKGMVKFIFFPPALFHADEHAM